MYNTKYQELVHHLQVRVNWRRRSRLRRESRFLRSTLYGGGLGTHGGGPLSSSFVFRDVQVSATNKRFLQAGESGHWLWFWN